MGVCFESLRFIELGVFLKYAGQPFDFIFQQMKWTIISRMCVGGVFVWTQVLKQVSKKYMSKQYIGLLSWHWNLELSEYWYLNLKFTCRHFYWKYTDTQFIDKPSAIDANCFSYISMFLSNKFLQGPSNRSNACTSKQPHFTGPLACILAARGLFVKKASSPKNFPLSKVTKWTDFSGSDLSSPFLVISTSPLTTM